MTKEVIFHLIDAADVDAVSQQALNPLIGVLSQFRPERVQQAYRDVIDLYEGRHPDYFANDTEYHDLEHASATLLCTANMIHGAVLNGLSFDQERIEVALIAALYHDTGFIRRKDEIQGNGSQFMVGHEARSMAVLDEYLESIGYSEALRRDGKHYVACTALMISPKNLPFRSDDARQLGYMMGAADLIAQMSDRSYLEKLLLLYREYDEAQIRDFTSELDLLEKTRGFYDYVVRKRLDEGFDGIHDHLLAHARLVWQLPHDPYMAAIQKNLDYLDSKLNEDRSGYKNWLRRNGIVDSLMKRPLAS